MYDKAALCRFCSRTGNVYHKEAILLYRLKEIIFSLMLGVAVSFVALDYIGEYWPCPSPALIHQDK
jgi:hypothetical protein